MSSSRRIRGTPSTAPYSPREIDSEMRLPVARSAVALSTSKLRPTATRAPFGQDAGFLYDSSLMASDDAYEILLDKQPTGVVELPIERILDDFPYFGGATNGGMPNPDLIEQVFRSEFDVAYEEGGLFILTMHPHITGHRSRVAGLEKLIVHMKSKPGVWFATHEQIARYVKANASKS